MCVLGTAARPAAPARRAAFEVEVVARRQAVVRRPRDDRGDRERPVPARPRPRAPGPPRRRPGRGAGVRARAAANGARCAPGSPTGAHVPAPPDPRRARPGRSRCGPPGRLPLEVDGEARAPVAGLRDRGRYRRLPAPALVRETAPGRHCGPLRRRPSPVPSPSMLYAPEQFTDDEAATLRPYFTNLDGPVFALDQPARGREGRVVRAVLAFRQEPAPALPRRVRRRPRPHRRPHRRRHRRPAARRGALRARVLRVRRRLRRAARRRAPRVRAGVEPAHEDPRVGPPDGVPRAVDALHPVRLAAATAATATSVRRRCASRRLGMRYVADLDGLFDTYSAHARPR